MPLAQAPKTIYEDTNPKKLASLLYDVNEGTSVLPDFQRDFVWEPGMTVSLLASVASQYPAGSLLRVRNTREYFAWRYFAAAPSSQSKPTFLFLDGQQRLTSLYQAFYGKGDYRFYMRLPTLEEGGDPEDAIFYERVESRAEKYYRDQLVQAKELVMPLELFRGQHANIWPWIMSTAQLTATGDRDLAFKVQERLLKISEQWLKPIEDYEFPVVTLSDSTDANAICTIFETLNKTGVKLTIFELLTARFYPLKFNLRAKWNDACEEYPILREYSIDPYQLLQAITLRSTDADGAPSCKRGAILKLSRESIDFHWDAVVAGLADGLELLREECGKKNNSWLPYAPMLVPLMALLAKLPSNNDPNNAVRRNQLIQWFWCASLGARYDAAANTKAELDYIDLFAWLSGGAPPNTIKEFSFDVTRLVDVTPRQRALYRALMCISLKSDLQIRKDRARDFNSGKIIDAAMIRKDQIDDHHIFYKCYLSKFPQSGSEKVDCIADRTLIDAVTNRHEISDRAPADYLGDVRNAVTVAGQCIEGLLGSHMIESGAGAAIWSNNFGGFLEERIASFRGAIQRATGSKIV